MSKIVVDSSVVLAVVYNETGWERALEYLDDGVISTVNLAEVQAKLVANGMPSDAAWKSAMNVVSSVVAFDEEQGRTAGDLISKTREFGLSLGDRACLALGIALGVPVCTTDRIWERLNLGIEIHLIR